MDYAFAFALNGFALRSALAAGLAIFLASYLIWFEAAAVFCFWLADRKKRMLAAFSAVVSAALSWLLSQGLGLVYFRPRPFADHAGIHTLIVKSGLEKSFPSDHVVIAFALAAAVALINRRWGLWLLISAAFISVGRIAVGVHYSTDVLAGAIIGCAIAYFVHRLIHFILKTRHHPHD